MSDVWFRTVVIIFGSVMGSGGFWAFLRSRDTRANARTRLMMGIAYDRITTLGIQYIERGSVTKDEYEDLYRYFFEPYKALGGNGTAERIMNDVRNLPFRSHNQHPDIFRNREEGWVNHVRVIAPREGQDTPVE